MTDFPIDIVLDPGAAARGAAVVRGELEKLEQRARITSTKMAEIGQSLGSRTSFGEVLTTNGDQVLDMFEGWKSGATEATSATKLLDSASSALGVNLGKLGVIAAAAFAAKKVIEYSDAFTNLQNKLANVTTGSDDLANVTNRLFSLANETRSGVEATASLYSRLAANTTELGLSQNDLFDITSTLSKAMKVSGVSATEAGAALIQLSQGLASGTLRGDELNSVFEQTPILARGIAESMGIPIGKLREMASQGKVTAAEVIKAVQGMKGEIDEKFAKTAPTFGDLFTKIENKLIEFSGKVGPALAPLIEGFGELIDLAGELLRVVGEVTGAIAKLGGALGRGSSASAGADELVRRALADPEIKAKIDANTEAINRQVASLSEAQIASALLRADELQRVTGSLGEASQVVAALRAQQAEYEALGQRGKAGLEAVNAAMGTLPGTIANIKIKQIVSDFDELAKVRGKIDPTIEATKKLAAVTRALKQEFKEKHDLVAFVSDLAAARAELFGTADAVKALDDAFAKLNKMLADDAKARADKAAEAYKKFRGELQALLDEVDPLAAKQRSLAAAEVLLEKAVRKSLLTQDAANEALRVKRALTDAQLGTADAIVQGLQDQIALTKAGTEAEKRQVEWIIKRRELEGKGITDAEIAKIERLTKELNFQKDLRDWEKERAGIAKEAADAAEKRAAAEAKFRSNAPGVTNRNPANDNSGLPEKDEWNQQLDSIKAVSSGAKEMRDAFGDAADAIREFVKTGKVDLASLADSILRGVEAIIAIQQATKGSGGFATGGSFTVGGGPPGQDLGNNATGGSYMVGGSGGTDTTPVFFRATRGERVDILTPAQQRAQAQGGGGGGGGGGVVIHNHLDSSAYVPAFKSSEFGHEVNNLISRRARSGRR